MNDIFDIECKICDLKAHIVITQNPFEKRWNLGSRVPMLANGGWFCPNCSAQFVAVRKQKNAPQHEEGDK